MYINVRRDILRSKMYSDDSNFLITKYYPTRKNSDEAKRFVAFCNYNGIFIPNFAESSKHITILSRKNSPFEWTHECVNVLKYLKKHLLSPKILQYSDLSKEFCFITDASLQLPIAYASRTFTKEESNKSKKGQKLTALYWAIQYFRPTTYIYTYCRTSVIKSDHRTQSKIF